MEKEKEESDSSEEEVEEVSEEESDQMSRTRVTSVAGDMSPILVFAAMMLVNGVERPGLIASGIGLPIFISSWVMLALANSFILQE